ncbi:hypothetical protein V2W45_1517847 [Cenococcum geophilum]
MVSTILAAAVLIMLIHISRRKPYSSTQCPSGTQLSPGPKEKAKIFVENLLEISLHTCGLSSRNGQISTARCSISASLEGITIQEQTPAAAQLLGVNLRSLLIPYNGKVLSNVVFRATVWRHGRRLAHRLTVSTTARRYEPTQVLESTDLLHYLTCLPRDCETWLRLLELVDTFLGVVYVPKSISPFEQEFRKILLEDVRQKIVFGTGESVWNGVFFENRQDCGLEDEEGTHVIVTLFETGSGTTAAAMIVRNEEDGIRIFPHPGWNRWRQNIPWFNDMFDMHVVRAVAYELLCWHPGTAGGVPHQLVKNGMYNGLFLSATTSYATYREPLHILSKPPSISAFGFGSCIYPGRNVAERSSSSLMQKARDAEGKRSKWFDFDLRVRSEERKRLAEVVVKEAKGNDSLARRK